MTQQTQTEALKNNDQQAKQFNKVATYINESIRQEMPVFIKLVQFDVATKMQKDFENDAQVDAKPAAVTGKLDEIFHQIDKDLEKVLTEKFGALK